ncbi:MAG: WD40 repeat domain-containing protein [Gemmataceae bacterium]
MGTTMRLLTCAIVALLSFHAEAAAPPWPRCDKRIDSWNDPLPSAAIARLGSVRFRESTILRQVTFTPDASGVMVAGEMSRAVCVRVATGDRLFVIELERDKTIQQIMYTPNGKEMLIVDSCGELHVFDAATQVRTRLFKALLPGLAKIAISRSGRTLAAASENGVLALWNWPSMELVRRIVLRGEAVRSVALAADERRLIAATEKHMYCWDSASSQAPILLQQLSVGDVVASNRGDMFASGELTGKILLRQMVNLRAVREVCTENELHSFAISLDDSMLATSGHDERVRLWRIADGRLLRTLAGICVRASHLAFSPDGRLLAACESHGQIRIWDVSTGRELTSRFGHYWRIDVAAFSASGDQIATGGYDRIIRIWDVCSGVCVKELTSHSACVSALQFAPNGCWLASTDWRGDVYLWQSRSYQLTNRWVGRQQLVATLAFTPDSRHLVAADCEGWIRIWNIPLKQEAAAFRSEGSQSVVVCPHHNSIAAFLGPEKILVRAIPTGKVLSEMQLPDSVNKAAPRGWFVSEDHLLTWDARSEEACLWDWRHSRLLRRIPLQVPGHPACAAISPDCELLAIGSFETGNLALIHVGTGAILRSFLGHRRDVTAVSFSPDGTHLVSAGEDGIGLVWDLLGRRQRQPIVSANKHLNECWNRLSSNVPALYYDAIWGFARNPGQALPYLKERIKPVYRADATLVRMLIRQLDHDSFVIREKATRDLVMLGDQIEPVLRELDKATCSLEVQSRIDTVLATLEQSPQRSQLRRALLVLGYCPGSDALTILYAVASGDPKCWLTIEAKKRLNVIEAIVTVREGSKTQR